MNISTFDQNLLALVEFHPDRTLKELARLLRSKEQTVAYRLSRLREDGIIRRSAIINHAALGYTNMIVYFSLRSYSDQTFDRLRAEIQKSDRVVWFGSLAGDFQFGMAYLVRHPEEIVNFLKTLSEKLKLTFSRKEITTRTGHHCFARGYLGQTMKNRPQASMLRPPAPIVLNELDEKILRYISSASWRSLRHLSELCRAPASTVERRVEKLVSSGAARLVYSIDPEKLGVTSYRLLIRTERFESGLHQKVINFCAAQPGTVMLFESVGPWDFEIDIEAESAYDVRHIQQELDSATGGAISEVRVLSELEDYKFFFYPMRVGD